jgi:hypothetical protein
MFNRQANAISSIDKFRKDDCNLVYLFTNARDEPNIAEWVSHHLLLGFDRIHIFDHKSVTPISQKLGTILNNNVTVQRVEEDGNIKLKMIADAVEIATYKKASWMLYLDADEFLLLNKLNNIKELLTMFNFADALAINWLMFGTSGHKAQPPGLLTENFIRSDKMLNPHVKTFVRPEKVKLPIQNPHFYHLTNPNRNFAATGNKKSIGPFNSVVKLFINVYAYIAHYYSQSEAEFNRRKGRPMDDGSGARPGFDAAIHNNHNDVANNQLQNKYSQRIKDFLAQHNIKL